eukprot:755749-Hanusia_phi.AAC.6
MQGDQLGCSSSWSSCSVGGEETTRCRGSGGVEQSKLDGEREGSDRAGGKEKRREIGRRIGRMGIHGKFDRQ